MSTCLEDDELAAAMCTGAVCALRRRAERQSSIARAGTVAAEGRPDVFIRSGEAAIALRLGECLERSPSEVNRMGFPNRFYCDS
jgi:hypothetical protein